MVVKPGDYSAADGKIVQYQAWDILAPLKRALALENKQLADTGQCYCPPLRLSCYLVTSNIAIFLT